VLIENILSGNRIRASVLGIGINVNQTEFDGLPFASSLQLKMGVSFNLTNLLNNLLAILDQQFQKCTLANRENFLESFNQRIYRKGEVCLFEEKGHRFESIIHGVNVQGELILELENGMKRTFKNGSVKMIWK